ncbi:MAG: hypothetical protein AAGG48_23705 [Planctomycetota bacterium]
MRRNRRAVVLLMTLAMIALASLAMTRIANHSMETVRRGLMAQKDVQQRWTQRTCREVLLERAEELFEIQDEQILQRGAGWPLESTLDLNIQLGGESLKVMLRDEQSSANLNWLHSQKPQQLPTIVAQAALASYAPIRLRPLDTSSPQHSRAFVSWGQVIDFNRLDPEDSLLDSIDPLNETFTCWGKPRLNLKRASDDAIRLIAASCLDPVQIGGLLQTRRGFDGELETLWRMLEIHRTKQLQLNRLFGTDSECYSLWLIRPTADRDRSTLMVSDTRARSDRSALIWHW